MVPVDIALKSALPAAHFGFYGFEEVLGSLFVNVLTIDGDVVSLGVTEEEAIAITRWSEGKELIQNALPSWSSDDRELLMTGITPEAWDDLLPEEDYFDDDYYDYDDVGLLPDDESEYEEEAGPPLDRLS